MAFEGARRGRSAASAAPPRTVATAAAADAPPAAGRAKAGTARCLPRPAAAWGRMPAGSGSKLLPAAAAPAGHARPHRRVPPVCALSRELTAAELLPLEYDPEALEAYCEARKGDMDSRWGTFLRLTVPFVARVGASFSMGRMEKDQQALARELVKLLTEMGPTFVKLGQLISSRADLTSPAVAAELSQLQNSVPQFSDLEAFKVMEEELGRPLEEVFAFVDRQAAAAASLAQVYKGTLHSGEVVAVKVQRPHVLDTVARDLVILHRGVRYYQSTLGVVFGAVGTTNDDFEKLLAAWSVGFWAELDFAREGRTQSVFREAIMASVPNTYVPKVYHEFSTRKLLVSEWVDGIKLTDCEADEINYLTNIGAECFLFQLLELGKFHGDPHPGNLMMLHPKEGEGGPDRLCLLDFGLVAEIPDSTRSTVACGIVHLAECDWPKLTEAMVKLEILQPDVDRAKVHMLMDRILTPFVMGGGGASKVADTIDSQQLAADLAAATADIPLHVPPYFALLSRAVSILEGIALIGNPNYSLVRAASPVAAQWLLQSNSDAAQLVIDQLMREAGMEGLIALATTASSSSFVKGDAQGAETGGAASLLYNAENPRAHEAVPELARWMLSENSVSAQRSLAGVLDPRAEEAQSIFSKMDVNVPPGPLRLLELAKAATSDQEARERSGEQASTPSYGGSADPCPDVQKAIHFLLHNSTPQVQQQVIAQSVFATDLCSRYIMRGMDGDGGLVGGAVRLLPGFVLTRGSQAWDSIFPPLSEEEAAQARELVKVALKSFGIRDVDELRALLNPAKLLASVSNSGGPLHKVATGVVFMADVTINGEQPAARAHSQIMAQMRQTYMTRLASVSLV